jgi:probable F420-dependent oxidoreductase
MKFSVALATCMEGLVFPVPFVEEDTFEILAAKAEHLGFHSVWANDHVSTQRYVQHDYAQPPRYFDPLITLAYLAGQTERVRLGIAVVVLPLRNPVILAKQVSTLDRLSEGRLEVAVGIGAYREEFEALHPITKRVHRGKMLDEGLQCLLTLLNDRRSSFDGKYFSFRDVECYPKPIQDPFPLIVGGNNRNNIIRAARWGQGWLPAALRPNELSDGVKLLYREADRFGRAEQSFEVAPQYAVSLGRTHKEAIVRFKNSQLYRHFTTLRDVTLKDQSKDLTDQNLIGSRGEVLERIHLLVEAGMTHCAALLFPANSANELVDQMQEFAETIISEFV